ncbi:MAG: sigma-70 family RNA polymerase sigma factor, partial [Acidimicrobiaceae bacterium]|nr:sigma-70 family RNA polymerase sigma factor [Acidimicrobiaceae bacterium]
RTAANLACDQARRRQRRERLRILPASSLSPSLEDAIVDRRLLLDQLRKLPTRQREAVVLRYLADLPASEVALAMGLSDETIKTHLDRGLAHLRSALAIDQGVDLGVH